MPERWHPLTQPELEAIERRVRREQVYTNQADCSQAIADRRALLEHLFALQAAGERALAIAAAQDTAAEAPDEVDLS